jgi:hypothetical protein
MGKAKSTGEGTVKRRNYVHKHSKQFNRAVTMADRKKQARRGYRKHKGDTGNE